MTFAFNLRMDSLHPCDCPSCRALSSATLTTAQQERRRALIEHHRNECRKRLIMAAVERLARRAVRA